MPPSCPPAPLFRSWQKGAICFCVTCLLAFGLRLLEWPCWQNPEYRFGNEMLLATHDAYHWLAGANGFGLASGHPMSLLLRYLHTLTGLPLAQIAFWFPAVLASLVAGIVFLWSWALGSLQAGIAAGLIASISPGFLGRTLLGFYDTDLVTLSFPLLIALPPACWAMRFIFRPAAISAPHKLPFLKAGQAMPACGNPLSAAWIAALALAGALSWWAQEWHSVFPYLIRYNIILLGLCALLIGPIHRKKPLFAGWLCYSLPALAGVYGLVFILLLLPHNRPRFAWLSQILASRWFLIAAAIFIFLLLARGEILDTLLGQINAYLKHDGDSHASGTTSLVFPSVAQSIIEVQDLALTALFPYFHPWLEAGALGLAGYALLILRRPASLFLLPLAALAILSSRLGGRMVMFGAPIVALGLALPGLWCLRLLLRRWLGPERTGWLACVLLCATLVAPFMGMIPALSQGPIINRRHAAALAQAGAITPRDATLWLWWDWGYAAHYFAARQTIADGARHGGPSLYLPAAVFATDNPRFARQIIRFASDRDNEPGNFFRDLDAAQAQELLDSLRSPGTPLVPGKGRQYIVVSFEMLKLGFWISNFGNWNFLTRQGEGGALSIVPQSVAYRLNAGEVRLADSLSVIYPASISVFAETGVTTKNYVQEWFLEHPDATQAQQEAWMASRRNINFLFNQVTDEKLAVDQGIYNSLMTQLLLCEANDPRFSPYFRLVYDNVFARIYEVLPAAEDSQPTQEVRH
ncbi:MAG: hypothetical protein HDQ91_06585 [Desulfovibrio sp.]|nr:hypothetical protein [Desulfovibrio sp.]